MLKTADRTSSIDGRSRSHKIRRGRGKAARKRFPISSRSSKEISSENPPPDDADLSKRTSNIEKGLPAIVPIEQRVSSIIYSDRSDPNIVDWDGPNDPAKALDWPSK